MNNEVNMIAPNEVMIVSLLQTLNRYLPRGNTPVGNYMFKVNNKNTSTRYEIYSKLTIKKP